MHIPTNPCSRQQQFAGVGRVDVELFPDRPFHQEPSVIAPRLGQRPDAVVVRGAADARFILQELGEGMMRDTAPRGGPRPHLDRANPSRLGHWELFAQRLPPGVLSQGRHSVGLGLDDDIRLAELFGQLPSFVTRPHLGGRHVFRVPGRLARIDPPDDRVNLLIRQRSVVLEFLDSNRSDRGATAAYCGWPRGP